MAQLRDRVPIVRVTLATATVGPAEGAGVPSA